MLTATVSSLTNGTLYQFAVLATNSIGDGSFSRPVAGTPTSSVTTPGPPKDLTVKIAQSGIVIFSWSAPDDDGGSDVTGYKYQNREKDTTTWNSWKSTTYTGGLYTDLTNGTTYEIQVVAVNSEGSGTISDILEVTPVVVPVRPGAPTNLTATAGDGQVELEWDAPGFDGHSEIIGYEYRYDTYNDGTWVSWTDTKNGTTRSVIITGLTNGTEYAFQVRAENGVGLGGASYVKSATPLGTTATKPTAPRNLSASPHSTNVGWATLTWDAPTSDGGDTITHYEWRYCTRRSNGTWGSWSRYKRRNSAATSMNLRGLTSGVLYGFQVRAGNNVGEGPGSNTTSTRGKE